MGNAPRFFTFLVALSLAGAGQAQTPLRGSVDMPLRPAPVAQAGADISLLGSTNPFDPQRAMWPDRVPPPPPPPAPPPPATVTDQDLQLYGVTIVGNSRLATVKVGKRFGALAPEGRAFATVAEGQALGEFTLAQVQPNQIVLKAPGGQQTIGFTKKADRSAASSGATAPAPVQTATEAVSTPQEGAPQGGTPATAPAGSVPAAPMPAPVVGAGSLQVNRGADTGSNAASPATPAASPMGGSLAEALSAARARAAQGGGASGRPDPIFGNPFNQK